MNYVSIDVFIVKINMILDEFNLRRYCDMSLSNAHDSIPLLDFRRFILAKNLIETPKGQNPNQKSNSFPFSDLFIETLSIF
jgi:hypothetical protein